MISKNKIKYIHSLNLKKNRDAQDVFVAEGSKIVGDILARGNSKVELLVAQPEWLDQNAELLKDVKCEIVEVSYDELAKVSFLCHPQQVMAVFKKFDGCMDASCLDKKLTLVLDGVQDPGNLGTIIRIADWFGIEDIICSKDTVDVYNPKVVQATMGSIARVRVSYMDLKQLFEVLPPTLPVYGTLLEGNNMYSEQLSHNGIIIMGNEGKGISPQIRQFISKGLRIPNYPEGRDTADSLNVAVATAIICAEFRRR